MGCENRIGGNKKFKMQRFVFGQLLKHAADKDSQQRKHVLERQKDKAQAIVCIKVDTESNST